MGVVRCGEERVGEGLGGVGWGGVRRGEEGGGGVGRGRKDSRPPSLFSWSYNLLSFTICFSRKFSDQMYPIAFFVARN